MARDENSDRSIYAVNRKSRNAKRKNYGFDIEDRTEDLSYDELKQSKEWKTNLSAYFHALLKDATTQVLRVSGADAQKIEDLTTNVVGRVFALEMSAFLEKFGLKDRRKMFNTLASQRINYIKEIEGLLQSKNLNSTTAGFMADFIFETAKDAYFYAAEVTPPRSGLGKRANLNTADAARISNTGAPRRWGREGTITLANWLKEWGEVIPTGDDIIAEIKSRTVRKNMLAPFLNDQLNEFMLQNKAELPTMSLGQFIMEFRSYSKFSGSHIGMVPLMSEELIPYVSKRPMSHIEKLDFTSESQLYQHEYKKIERRMDDLETRKRLTSDFISQKLGVYQIPHGKVKHTVDNTPKPHTLLVNRYNGIDPISGEKIEPYEHKRPTRRIPGGTELIHYTEELKDSYKVRSFEGTELPIEHLPDDLREIIIDLEQMDLGITDRMGAREFTDYSLTKETTRSVKEVVTTKLDPVPASGTLERENLEIDMLQVRLLMEIQKRDRAPLTFDKNNVPHLHIKQKINRSIERLAAQIYCDALRKQSRYKAFYNRIRHKYPKAAERRLQKAGPGNYGREMPFPNSTVWFKDWKDIQEEMRFAASILPEVRRIEEMNNYKADNIREQEMMADQLASLGINLVGNNSLMRYIENKLMIEYELLKKEFKDKGIKLGPLKTSAGGIQLEAIKNEKILRSGDTLRANNTTVEQNAQAKIAKRYGPLLKRAQELEKRFQLAQQESTKESMEYYNAQTSDIRGYDRLDRAKDQYAANMALEFPDEDWSPFARAMKSEGIELSELTESAYDQATNTDEYADQYTDDEDEGW